MARLVLNGGLTRAGNDAVGTVQPGIPRYAFISNPACCPKCSLLDTRTTGRLYTVGDTWRISHINCLCYTIEVPAGVGIGIDAVKAFAANPIGGTLRRGFSYGKSFAPVKLTANNLQQNLEKAQRMATTMTKDGRRGQFARFKAKAQVKGAYRRAYNKASENWNNVGLDMDIKPKKGEAFNDFAKRASDTKNGTLKASAAKVVKVREDRAEKPMFTMSGGISSGSDVAKKKKKKKAAEIKAKRNASASTKSMAKLFGATIK